MVNVDIRSHGMPNRCCHETVPLLSPALFLDSSAALSRDELPNIIHPLQVPDNLHNISVDLSFCHTQTVREEIEKLLHCICALVGPLKHLTRGFFGAP